MNPITTTGTFGIQIRYDSVLEAMDGEQIFSIHKNKDGLFVVTEKCDEYFACTLTRDQLIQLADEIRALVG